MRLGFTIVELMIVVAVLGILAALVVPRFSDATDKTRLNSTQKQLQTLRSQITLYESQQMEYPPSVVAGTDWTDLIGGGYLMIVPRNALRDDATDLSAGPTINVGAAIPANTAWYWDTTVSQLYASDENGNRLDF